MGDSLTSLSLHSGSVTPDQPNNTMKQTKKEIKSAKKLATQPRCATPRKHKKAHRKAEPKVKVERCLDLISKPSGLIRKKQMNQMEAAFHNAN